MQESDDAGLGVMVIFSSILKSQEDLEGFEKDHSGVKWRWFHGKARGSPGEAFRRWSLSDDLSVQIHSSILCIVMLSLGV